MSLLIGIGILCNVGRPLRRRLLSQASTTHTQYIQHINTYTVNQLIIIYEFVICSVGQCLLSGGATIDNLLPWPRLECGTSHNHWPGPDLETCAFSSRPTAPPRVMSEPCSDEQNKPNN